jgi:thiol-disulfide isomerase/thioredoxin
MSLRRFRILGWLALGLPLAALGWLALRPADRSDSVRARPAAEVPQSVRPALAALRGQANQLLDGGTVAFKQRLVELRGAPVVVNQWASWCGPCRYEFPFFQHLAKRYRGRVAFLGVDSQDAREDARRFLREFPVPFPHYFDPDGRIARVFGGARAWPSTGFYDATGRLTRTHLGAYATEAKLDEDIRRYALGG